MKEITNPPLGRDPRGAFQVENEAAPLTSMALAALVIGVSVALGGPLLATGVVLVPLVMLAGYAKPEAVFLLFFAMLPLVGDARVLGVARPSILATAVVSIFAAVTFLRRGERVAAAAKSVRGVITALVAMAGLGVLSTLANLNEDVIWNLFEAGFKPIYFAGMMLLVLTQFVTARQIQLLCWAFVAGSAFAALYALYTYAAGVAPVYRGAVRLTGTFSEFNALGSYMLLTAMFTIAVSELPSQRSRRLLLRGIAALQILTLLLSLTLGSMLGVATALGVFLMLRSGKVGGLVKYALVVSLVGVAIVLFLPSVAAKIATIQERIVGRLATFEVGLTIIRDNLWFGVGSKNVLSYILANPESMAVAFGVRTQSVPHNVFINTFVQKGLFVFLALVAVLVVLARYFSRYYRIAARIGLRGFAAALAGGMIGFVQQDLSNNMLLHPRIGLFFFMFLPVLVCAVRSELGNRNEPDRFTGRSMSNILQR